MCECNLKNSNLGAFFKERGKKESVLILKTVIVEFEFA